MVSVFGWPDLNTWDVPRVKKSQEITCLWLVISQQLSQHPAFGHIENAETIRYFFNYYLF